MCHSVSCAVVAEDGNGGMQRDYWYDLARSADELDSMEAVGRTAASRLEGDAGGRAAAARLAVDARRGQFLLCPATAAAA